MMIFINAVYKESIFPKEYALGFVKLLNPICPHLGEELWSILGNEESIAYEPWPIYDEEKNKEETFTLVVQVNGKVRGKIDVDSNTTKEKMEQKALEIDNVKKYLEGLEIVKIVTIPGKLVSIVAK